MARSRSSTCKRSSDCERTTSGRFTAFSSEPRAFCSARGAAIRSCGGSRSEEHTSELQSRLHLVCRLLLEKKKKKKIGKKYINQNRHKRKIYNISDVVS